MITTIDTIDSCVYSLDYCLNNDIVKMYTDTVMGNTINNYFTNFRTTVAGNIPKTINHTIEQHIKTIYEPPKQINTNEKLPWEI